METFRGNFGFGSPKVNVNSYFLWSSVWLRIITVTLTWRGKTLHCTVSVSVYWLRLNLSLFKEIFSLVSRYGTSLSNSQYWAGSRRARDFPHANLYEQITTIKSLTWLDFYVCYWWLLWNKNKRYWPALTSSNFPSDWKLSWQSGGEADQGGGRPRRRRGGWIIAVRWLVWSGQQV